MQNDPSWGVGSSYGTNKPSPGKPSFLTEFSRECSKIQVRIEEVFMSGDRLGAGESLCQNLPRGTGFEAK